MGKNGMIDKIPYIGKGTKKRKKCWRPPRKGKEKK